MVYIRKNLLSYLTLHPTNLPPPSQPGRRDGPRWPGSGLSGRHRSRSRPHRRRCRGRTLAQRAAGGAESGVFRVLPTAVGARQHVRSVGSGRERGQSLDVASKPLSHCRASRPATRGKGPQRMLDFVEQAVRAARGLSLVTAREISLRLLETEASLPSSGRACLARCRFCSKGASWKGLVFAVSRESTR